MSRDGSPKNEIHFIMTTKRQIYNDVSVIHNVAITDWSEAHWISMYSWKDPVWWNRRSDLQMHISVATRALKSLGKPAELRVSGRDNRSHRAKPRKVSRTSERGRNAVRRVLQRPFNSRHIRRSYARSMGQRCGGVFLQDGNILLKNYRPILLLSYVYKLLSRVITNRLAPRFDNF